MSYDVDKATEGLENEFWGRWIDGKVGAELILQLFHCFTYITAHSPILLLLYLHHSSFSNPSIASPTSQFILQPFFRFSYVTSSSVNSPGGPRLLTDFHIRLDRHGFTCDWVSLSLSLSLCVFVLCFRLINVICHLWSRHNVHHINKNSY